MTQEPASDGDRSYPLPERLRRLAELRRGLPVLAAVMLLVAVTLPIWRIYMHAPQYPDGLVVELYAYPRLGGDYQEVQALNQYVGFYYPDPVLMDPNYTVHDRAIATPEWVLGPLLFVGVAAAGVFVALAPTERKLRLGLTGQLLGSALAFLGTFAIVQYRLHQAGQSLDPDAPLVGVDAFTPPLLGSYEIANMSGTAWFGPGGYLAGLAFLTLVVAWLARGSRVTFAEFPGVAAAWVRQRRAGEPSEGTGEREADDPRGVDADAAESADDQPSTEASS